jgi:CheY-like chemotaxis protein
LADGQQQARPAATAEAEGRQPELPARRAAHALPPGGGGQSGVAPTVAPVPAQQPPHDASWPGRAPLPEQAAGMSPVPPQGKEAPARGNGAPAQDAPGSLPEQAGAMSPVPPQGNGHRAHNGAPGPLPEAVGLPAAPPRDERPGGALELPPAAPQSSGRRARTPVADTQSAPGALPPAVVDDAANASPPATRHASGQEAPAGGGQAISVRSLGQGVPFALPEQTQPRPAASSGSGRRRKLAAPQATAARPQGTATDTGSNPAFQASDSEGQGQAFAIGAPADGVEGPELLDGPNGAVEVRSSVTPEPAPAEDPAEPTTPRRLLVWPEPDVSTRQALTDRGYRPVTVRSREEVDAQVAEYPAALFVDPLTGPITRTALQSLRAAAVAAEVPVLVTAGLGQATREAAYGADPAVLLKALAPRDGDQRPPRVLLVESHQDIASAFTATLERRGMQVAHAASEGDAATLAAQTRPNLVVMDLMLVRRRRVGIVDWLRANGLLNRTPLVVYTSVDIDAAELPRLGTGETVLFLAERSTSAEVQGRIVDLLGKIGTEV